MCAQLNNVKNLYQIWIQEAHWWCLAVSDPYTSGCIFHMWSGYETSVTFLFWRQQTFDQGLMINQGLGRLGPIDRTPDIPGSNKNTQAWISHDFSLFQPLVQNFAGHLCQIDLEVELRCKNRLNIKIRITANTMAHITLTADARSQTIKGNLILLGALYQLFPPISVSLKTWTAA